MVLARCGAELFHTPYVALPLLAPVKLIMTIHDLIFERFPEYMPRRWLRGVYRAQTVLGARRAAAILTVSEATRADVEGYYGAGRKTRVIRNAVDSTFRPVDDPARRREVRERYRLPERFVLTVGAGRPHKNVETLVEAMARLGPERGVALVLAGEFDERFEDGVAGVVRARGLKDRVRRTGPVRDGDLPTLYSLAEVFAFPSLVEGFGLPPLEAMACGVPVVASNASSIPEVVGDAGLLFAPRDPDDLAATLARVLDRPEPRAELSRRGRARAAEFTWDRVARATLAVYDELLGARPASTVRLVSTL